MPADTTPPAIIRPIPRRPFNPSLTSASPPDDVSALDSQPVRNGDSASSLRSSLLDPKPRSSSQFSADTPEETDPASISRTQSILNLTQSALFGIYSPTMTGNSKSRSNPYSDRTEPGTPWGTGAQTPGRPGLYHPNVEEDDPERAEALLQLRERLGAASKSQNGGMLTGPMSPTGAHFETETALPAPHTMGSVDLLTLTAKAVLLFVLGACYGMVVYRLRDEHMSASLQQHQQRHANSFFPAKGSYDKIYIAFWGASGVLLGSLLPWFDQFCDRTLGAKTNSGCSMSTEEVKDVPTLDTDWALVIRGVGCFAGIAFAIRKLPWDSTMQVSLTLALVNPFLWYLIDRSKSGFMLASAVGVIGATVIAGLDPDMMPTPMLYDTAGMPLPRGSDQGRAAQLALGGLARRATLEAAIWMLSVLFCSYLSYSSSIITASGSSQDLQG
uniref:INSIG domain-containing protein n=1 Tax=Pyricularia oryzae (strain P131) TaxID=1143193 RepID=L7JEV2_PYRO1